MEVTRSVTCHFSSLTQAKRRQLQRLQSEYHKVVATAIVVLEPHVLSGCDRKSELLKASYRSNLKTWLTSRATQNAYAEALWLLKAAVSASKETRKPYKRPKHCHGHMLLSMTNAKVSLNTELKEFDLLVELRCFDSLRTKKLAIPLKKHKLFNEYRDTGWDLSTSVCFRRNCVQLSFSKDIKKKDHGGIVGVDPGATNVLSTDSGEFYGTEIRPLLDKLRRKSRRSKAWYRCRTEIQCYINKAVKSLPYEDLKLVALEDNRRIKHKSKLKGRLSKNVRSVLSGWAIGRINTRVEMLCEANGVRLRRVPAWNNSRKCPCCGYTEKGNRATQELFICLSCGHTQAADTVGGINTLARLALGPYGAEYKSDFLEKHPTYWQDNVCYLRS